MSLVATFWRECKKNRFENPCSLLFHPIDRTISPPSENTFFLSSYNYFSPAVTINHDFLVCVFFCVRNAHQIFQQQKRQKKKKLSSVLSLNAHKVCNIGECVWIFFCTKRQNLQVEWVYLMCMHTWMDHLAWCFKLQQSSCLSLRNFSILFFFSVSSFDWLNLLKVRVLFLLK